MHGYSFKRKNLKKVRASHRNIGKLTNSQKPHLHVWLVVSTTLAALIGWAHA